MCVALRLPWFDAPLGRDEGGVELVARAWQGSHPFPYGPYFLDRPPVLVLLYRLAGDPSGIRILGMLAASAGVLVCTLLAAHVSGRRAALPAAVLTAAFLSSVLLDAVFTPAELLAMVPSAASVLLLVTGLGRERGAGLRLAGAGACAALALLVKQSFGDALAAGVVGLAIAAVSVPWRRTAARAGAYAAGVAAAAAAILVWALAAGTSASSPHSVYYALAGFRFDAVHALTHGDVGKRLTTIGTAALGSGIALAFPVAIAGLLTLRRRRVTAGVLGAWLLAAIVGIVGGGSFWAHYLIELVPVTVVGVAALVAWRPWLGAALGALVLLVTAATSADHVALGRPAQYQRSAVVLGHYLHSRAQPGDTAYVLYAKVNALYYSGLPSPFPYHWSLMLESVPHVEAQLRALLASPRRPTWILKVDGTRTYGLDRSGQTARLLHRYYRRADRVCGVPILLARSAGTRPAVPTPSCANPAGRTVDLDF